MTGKLIILTGYSGSGKDTLMKMLLEGYPNYQRLITHTTRPIRPEEKHGIDYYFVSSEIFKKMIREDKLVEHVVYGSHYKGTSKKEFQKVFSGQNIIWRIDMQRAAIIEETFLEKFDKKTATKLIEVTKKIMVTVPSNEALSRYKKREGANANLNEFEKRIQNDLLIWEKSKKRFPHIVENFADKEIETLNKIIKIIE